VIQKDSKTGVTGESRRSFARHLSWISTLVVLSPLLRLLSSKKIGRISCAPGSGRQTMKMLTREGKLVEVDQSLLAPNAQKITNEELQQWVVRK
jgi:hypothetical protein